MRALVTGGAGFIGSHLAEHLVRCGWSVVAIDDLSTGSADNLAHLAGSEAFRLIVGSVTDRPTVARVMDDVDVVFHLAAAVGVRLIIERPIHTLQTNLLGTEVVLEVASQRGQRVVLTSTSEVYGKTERTPFREDDDLVLGPTAKSRWSYACSKAIDEFLGFAYGRERSLPVVITRLFNTIGPRQTGAYGMVVPTLVRQALAGEAMTVFGDGSQARCFTWVGDVVRVLADLATHRDAPGRIFNVGGTEETSIGELATNIRLLTNSSSEIVLIPYAEAYEAGFEDMQRRVPDVSRLGDFLGYRPSMPLTEMLKRIIEDMRSCG
ncbi:MAG: nucleoside-diphosphate sugar epimerase [Betaproteobacteria bacterium RIFCSPLOWO2_02_FULL_64_12]|nr:MAG: nucleoside-diphosphate sugar epimerase [Betaproteobacteria bacterium RIFCSPLOWO2_02_FULL_64_12]